MNDLFAGFDDLSLLLKDIIDKTSDEKVMAALQKGADRFVADLDKLSKPYSQIHKAGYTHLIDTFSSRKAKKQVEVGWGKYYGPIVEKGSRLMKANPHMHPVFEKNANHYYRTMIDQIGILK